MSIRTDLAIESLELNPGPGDVLNEVKKVGDININIVNIKTQEQAQRIGRAIGKYITVESENFTDEDVHTAVRDELRELLPSKGMILVCGLGNTEITPDALGPQIASRVLATRHIKKSLAQEIGLKGLRSVAVLAPGVLGQTGIETMEIISSVCKKLKPAAVIVIDALAARSINRLCKTVQISNTGISPGSGVGNKRLELSSDTLGVPVISLGVPTVVDAETFAYDLTGEELIYKCGMFVTPRDIDMLIDRAGELIGHAINCALQTEIDEETLRSCV